jgi:hypothetical protein
VVNLATGDDKPRYEGSKPRYEGSKPRQGGEKPRYGDENPVMTVASLVSKTTKLRYDGGVKPSLR